MKKLFTSIVVLTSFFACQQAFAQITVGGGLVFGSEISQLGIDIRGGYQIDENWVAAPNINFFFADKESMPAFPPFSSETEIRR